MYRVLSVMPAVGLTLVALALPAAAQRLPSEMLPLPGARVRP
jgi:hypothetical protein